MDCYLSKKCILKSLSICQNWPARPLPDQSVNFDNEIGFFPRVFVKIISFLHTIQDLTDLAGDRVLI